MTYNNNSDLAYPMRIPLRSVSYRQPIPISHLVFRRSRSDSLDLMEALSMPIPNPIIHYTQTRVLCVPAMPSEQLQGRSALYIPDGSSKCLRVFVQSVDGYGQSVS